MIKYSPEEVWMVGFAMCFIAICIGIAPTVVGWMVVLVLAVLFVPMVVGILVLILWEVINDL